MIRSPQTAQSQRSSVPRNSGRPLSLFGLFGALVRLVASAVFALTLYVGAVELGRHAAISLPGSQLDFVLPMLIFGTLIALLLLPLFVLLSFACAFGTGLWLAALNVEYRDFRYIIPFIVQFGLYLSPVGFSSSIVPAKWRLVYALNPCVGIIDGFRWSLLRGESPLWAPSVLLSVAITVIICLSSIWYFRRMEKSFADVI